MEDYERELYGVEDDFHSQFAAELEVLAELEGGSGSRPAPGSLRGLFGGGEASGGRRQQRPEAGVGGASEREGPSSAADCVWRLAALMRLL